MFLMAKTTSINLRISPEFRDEIERLAAYHGLSMSSYAHSLLVRSIRREREATPEAFVGSKSKADELIEVPDNIAAVISTGDESRDAALRLINEAEIAVARDRLKPRKAMRLGQLKQKAGG